MLVDDLRNSILESAISGNLSKQNEDDKSSVKLVDNLYNTRKKLTEEKKILKKPFLDNSEINPPFAIPDNWSWAYLSNVSIIQEGAGIRKHQYKPSGIQLFSVTNILNGSIDLEKKQLYVSEKEFEEKYSHLKLNVGDIVTACSGGSWGKVAFYDSDATVMLNTSTLRMRFFNDLADNRYLYYFLQSKYFKKALSDQLVGIQPNFGYAHYSKIPIPIPPLEEQKTIVNNIENIFGKLDEVKLLEKELLDLKTIFPYDLKNSILNSAISGTLIPNNKFLDRSIEPSYSDIPFEIPDNWSWVKIDDVLDIQTGLGYKKTDQTTKKDGTLRVLRGGNINNNYQYELKDDDVYVSNIEKYTILEPGDILTPSVTSMEQMGKVAYIDKNLDRITAGGFVYIIRSKDFKILDPKYAMYFISSKFHKEMCKPNIHKSGQAFYNLKKSGLIEQPIPIPPLEEQYCIVNKLENILSICNDINRLLI